MFLERRRVEDRELYVIVDRQERVLFAEPTFDRIADRASTIDPSLLNDAQKPYRRLPPVVPSKIVCVGLNYHHHAEEMGKEIPDEPLIFLKPPTALIAHGDAIELPPSSELVHHEGELAIIVGRTLKNASLEEAGEAVFGHTIMNDVTARDIQRRENRYTRAKGFDTFAPLGPRVALDVETAELSITTRVNGEVRQQGPCSDMIFDVPWLLAFISSIMTLNPGDVVSTGTPFGVGPLEAGDLVEVEIPGIGTLSNPVKSASRAQA